MFVFNILGVVMICVAFGIIFGVAMLTGKDLEAPDLGPENILFGAMCIFFDVTYRVRQPDGHWISPFGGGNIFFIPVWGIGAAIVVAGLVHCFRHPLSLELFRLGLIALLVAGALGLAILQVVRCDRDSFWKFNVAPPAEPNEESPRARPQLATVRSSTRCPECDSPIGGEEIVDGKCPWCGKRM